MASNWFHSSSKLAIKRSYSMVLKKENSLISSGKNHVTIPLNTAAIVSLNNGAISEVKKFLKLKIKKDQSVNKVIGIAELTQYLNHEITLDEAEELISIKTRQYAKRQATWARTRMTSWIKIDLIKLDGYIKKLKKSSLKLDQLT